MGMQKGQTRTLRNILAGFLALGVLIGFAAPPQADRLTNGGQPPSIKKPSVETADVKKAPTNTAVKSITAKTVTIKTVPDKQPAAVKPGGQPATGAGTNAPGYTPTRELVNRLKTNNIEVILTTLDTISDQDSGSKYVLEAFSGLLNHTSAEVRLAVLETAGFFDSTRALLPALEKTLNDPDESVREETADVLGEIETRKMLEIFGSNLSSKHEDVRDNAEFYLQWHTDIMFTNQAQWTTWWKSNQNTFSFE